MKLKTVFPIVMTLIVSAALGGCTPSDSEEKPTAEAGPAGVALPSGETEPAPGAAEPPAETPPPSTGTADISVPDLKRVDDAIQWFGYDEGVEMGKNRNMKVFINFYADWCRYCKEMDRKTFKDRAVIDYLNENFIAIRVNSDKSRKTAAAFGVRALPVSWFVAEDGERIGNQPGYIPAETMLTLLKYIETDSYKEMKFTEFTEKS